ncbi:MAG: TatD family hydrolase [Selenomonadaceae bacterium]|nr:TatD family hydrolase [Selenomonadaceae bacterium]MBR1859084.1 TatD family hydrolase [Selenomonadaceae bacterium]
MNNKNNFVDTHCHLNDKQFADDLDDVIARANLVGVNRIINFGATLQDSAEAVELAETYDGLFAGVGVHPEEIDDFNDDNAENKIAEMAQNKKVVAIGEIGLDYHWEKDAERRLMQQKIFIKQLDIARQLNLPVCVHERDAHGDALKILKSEANGLRGVLHCFSGSLEMAREVWKMGWLIGVDGPLTFKNSAKLPEIIKAAPLDMLLIETDAPYMAPTPYRGKRNEPAYVVEVAKKIAELRGESLEVIAKLTTQNAESLYNIAIFN